MEYLSSVANLSGLAFVSLVSPGPDFAIVVKNSLVYSRKTALFTALGIALGILAHLTYILLGLGFVITQTPWLFWTIKCAGAMYLIYVGCQSLGATQARSAKNAKHAAEDISTALAVRTGFLTNALNPKCMLFLLSLFSVMIPTNTPSYILIVCGVIIFAQTLAWFSFVAFCLSNPQTRRTFSHISHWIERITGIILITLGGRLLLLL